MNQVLRDYLESVRRYLSPHREEEILAELADLIGSRAEETARKEGREPRDEDYRAAVGRMGNPARVAAGYSRERYIVGPSHFGAFFAYLGIVFSVHLGISLLLLIFDAGVWVLPGPLTKPFVGGLAQFVASLPGNFIFDFGLVALFMWQVEHWKLEIPFPKPVKVKLPTTPGLIGEIVGGLIFLFVLNYGAEFLVRIWSPGFDQAYRILGPGFHRGLPLLNLVIAIGLLVHTVLFFVKDRVGQRALLVVEKAASLIGIGLFFAQPEIIRFPEFLNLPGNLAVLLPKLVAVPVMIAIIVDLILHALALWQDTVAADA